jgi:uncharacterized protein YjgD (DUF1641 family)
MDDSPPVSNVPGLLESLARLDARLGRIEQRLDQLEQIKLTEAAPAFAAIAVDSVDDAARRLQERGVDLEERMNNALATLERLTSAQATEQLAQALELAAQVPNVVATLMDSVDERLSMLHDRGIDLDERLRTLGRIAERLTAPDALKVVETLLDHLPNLDRLLGSGVLGPGPIEIVSRAGQALAEAQQAAVHPLGAFGLFRALSDSGVQHSLGFAVAFARQLGRTMEPSYAPHALPSSTQ